MVDERLNDVDSNMLACRKVLLDSVGVEKIFRVDPALYEDPEAAAKDYERVLRTEFSDFHVIIMGMGGDGHTASLFPNHAFWDGYGGDELVAPVFDSPLHPEEHNDTGVEINTRDILELLERPNLKVKELMSISDEMKSKAEKKNKLSFSAISNEPEGFLMSAYYGERVECGFIRFAKKSRHVLAKLFLVIKYFKIIFLKIVKKI